VNRENFHVWNRHAARLFQTAPYDQLFLSNSWATRFMFVHGRPIDKQELFIFNPCKISKVCEKFDIIITRCLAIAGTTARCVVNFGTYRTIAIAPFSLR